MRIPIKAARDLGKRFGLTHVIIFATEEKDTNKPNHIVTWGRTLEACGQAADFGNMMKKSLGWPESLHQQPSRVRRLQKTIKELKEKLRTNESE